MGFSSPSSLEDAEKVEIFLKLMIPQLFSSVMTYTRRCDYEELSLIRCNAEDTANNMLLFFFCLIVISKVALISLF